MTVSPQRYFLDTEFLDDPQGGFDVHFISIGLISAAGREYYGVSDSIDEDYCARANPWLKDNVLDKLPPQNERQTLDAIRQGVLDAIAPAKTIEVWGKNASYDNYVLCRLFGGMASLRAILAAEKGIEKITFRDSNELRLRFGPPQTAPQDPATEHIAIADARQERLEFQYYEGLNARQKPRHPSP